jgi:hypothetical protein
MARQILRSKTAPIRISADEKAMHLIFLLLCLLPLAVSALLSTNGTFCTLHLFGLSVPMRSVCFFRLVTGYRCPVCGMTRCFAYMSHGNITAAWHMSHAGVPLYLFCIYETIYRLLRLAFGKFNFCYVFKVIETVLIVIVCAAVIFFFAAQFINSSIAY